MYVFPGNGGGKRRGHGRESVMHHSCWSTVVLEASQSLEAVYPWGIFVTSGGAVKFQIQVASRRIL